VSGRRSARIVVRVAREDDMASVRVTASGDGEAGEEADRQPSPVDALTIDAQVWAAAHLAAAQRGRVTVAESGQTLTLELRLPAG